MSIIINHVFCRYDAAEQKFFHQNFNDGRSNLAWIVDFFSSDDKSCSILFSLPGTYTAHKLAVCDVFHAVARDLTLVYELDGIGAFDLTAHAIRELSKFIC